MSSDACWSGADGVPLAMRSRRRAVRDGRLSVSSLEVVLAYASARARGDV